MIGTAARRAIWWLTGCYVESRRNKVLVLILLRSGYTLHEADTLGEMYISWFTCRFVNERELGTCWARKNEHTDKPSQQNYSANKHRLERWLIGKKR
jgi:hypothetical protein